MADLEEPNETRDLCRMCMDDLSTFEEYYFIEGELSELTESLTGISVDPNDARLPLNMCTNCFNILTNFNLSKITWIENQAQFLLEDAQESCSEIQNGVDDEFTEEILEEEQIEVDEVEVELADDSQNEYEYRVEYVDEMELNDVEIGSDKVEEALEDADSDISVRDNVKTNKPSTKVKSKRTSSEGVLKGKDIYQKLLKKCEECGKMIEKNRLEGHLNKHQNIRPYVCDMAGCSKSFYCKLLLRLHKTSIHTGQSVSCDVCDKVFPSDRSLYSHKLRHKNENKYNCSYCERKFNNSNSLKRHLAIHSGIREFSCELCSSSFYRKFNLDVHIRTVHQKTKLFSCEYCPKRFGYARLLRDHINKCHLNEHREAWLKVEA